MECSLSFAAHEFYDIHILFYELLKSATKNFSKFRKLLHVLSKYLLCAELKDKIFDNSFILLYVPYSNDI